MPTTPTAFSELRRWGRGYRAAATLAAATLLGIGIAMGVVATRVPVAIKLAEKPLLAVPGTLAGSPKPTAKPVVRVRITPERQQLIGVRTAVVGESAPENTLRTVGILSYDETRVTEIHTKVPGWVDTVNADFVGKSVRKGEPLLSIFSRDLVAAQLDYLLALKNPGAKAGPSPSGSLRLDQSLAEASRTRLELLDLTKTQIEALERTGQPAKTLTLYSPFTGVVIERKTFAGQYITPDMPTVKIADLSTIWAIAQVYEYELGGVTVGQTAEVLFQYQPVKPVLGRVSFISPDIDPQSRTARVRVEFKNPGVAFKPESFVTIVLHTNAKPRLSVPREAVIDTGARQYVLMALPDGFFEPRDVSVGEAQGDSIPVYTGLAAGERVVTSAQFLIDSETNLQAAMQSMSLTMPGMKAGGDEMKDMPAGNGAGDEMKGMDMPAGEMKGMDMAPDEMKRTKSPPSSPIPERK